MIDDKQHLWNSFIRLGEMIGDGMHYEQPWITKEYKRLMKILCPPTEEEKAIKAENRRKKNENINKQIKERLEKDKCSKCNSELKQTRKGEAKNALIGSLKYTLGYREYYDLKTYEVLEELIEKGTIKIEYYEGAIE